MFNPNQNWRVPLFLRATVICFLLKIFFPIRFLSPEMGHQKELNFSVCVILIQIFKFKKSYF